jgi:hypothetical protein
MNPDSVEYIFGRGSSASAAQALYERTHTAACCPATPCDYHAKKKIAEDTGLIFAPVRPTEE